MSRLDSLQTIHLPGTMKENDVNVPSAQEILQNDDYLMQFVVSNSEKEGSENTTPSFTSSLTASEQLIRLTKGIGLLEKELERLIDHDYDNLIAQGTWVATLKKTLINLQNHFQELSDDISLTRSKIIDPFNESSNRCLILTRLHDTSNILRCIIQIRKISKKIRSSNPQNASAMIKEIDNFGKEIDLGNVELLKNDRKIIEDSRQHLFSNERKTLIEALSNENEVQAISCVQILHNLGKLHEVMQDLKQSLLLKIDQRTQSALDIQSLTNESSGVGKIAPHRGVGPGKITGNTFPGVDVATFRTKLWSNLENLLNNVVYSACAQMFIFSSSLMRCHNLSVFAPEDHETFLEWNFIIGFWKQATENLSNKLIVAAEKSSFIKQALEAEYPKLLSAYVSLNRKLKILVKKIPASPQKILTQLISNNLSANQFEHAYLSRSVSRLLDTVHEMFSNNGPPEKSEIDSFVSCVSNELKVSSVDENLCKAVARSVGKAVRLFCIKSEQFIVPNEDTIRVTGSLNDNQQLNTKIANTVFYLRQQIQNVTSEISAKLTERCREEIYKSFKHIEEVENHVINPIVNSISEAIESIILTIHQEKFHNLTNQDAVSSSLFLKELQNFISRAHSSYLQPFHAEQLLKEKCLLLTNRCIELFIRHVCLVRPIDAQGRVKLVNDFKKVEIAIAPLSSKINSSSGNLRILRVLQQLISITDPSLIATNELVGKIIPCSLVLMFLFSHGPSDMLSPHESCGWTIARLSQWLDSHESEKDRLELISGTLQRYQQTITQKNETSFHKIYPVMMKVLENGFKLLTLTTSENS